MTTAHRRMALAVGIAGLLFGPGIVDTVRLSLEERRLDQRLARLTGERQRLVQEQARLEQDPTYIEGLIRSTFKLAKPGELVIPLSATERPGTSNQ